MKKRLIFLLTLCSIFISFSIFSQSNTSQLILKAKYDSGKMKLRWAPANYKMWEYGLNYGYKIERMTFSDESDKSISSEEMLNSRITLKDVALNLDSTEWKEMIQNQSNISQNDKLAISAIFSKSFSVQLNDSSSFANIQQLQSDKENRYNMALLAAEFDFNTAVKTGLGFDDSQDLHDGYSYIYYITPLGPDTIEPVFCFIKAVNLDLPVLNPIFAGGNDHNITIVWDGIPESYITYEIGRMNNPNDAPSIISSLPVMGESIDKMHPERRQFADSVALLNTPYYYKIRGIDNYGAYGPWSTPAIEGISKPAAVSVIPIVDTLSIINNSSIKIRWKFDTAFINRITGFGIMRAKSFDGNYTQLNTNPLSKTTFEFTDSSPLEVNYYIVIAVDDQENQLKSFPNMGQLVDHTPPSKPSTPVGVINKQGKVSLQWAANTDADLDGYRVYTNNNKSGEYTQITKELIKTNKYSYIMDIKNLQKNTYVKIRAYDKRSNHSLFSDSCKLEIPDVVPPQVPSIINAFAEAGNNVIEWKGSRTDVAHFIVKRRVKGTQQWKDIYKTSTGNPPWSYKDTLIKDTKAYEYAVTAEDASHNESNSNTVELIPLKPDRETVNSITITAQTGSSTKILWWVYPMIGDVTGFKIYRSKDNLPFKCVSTVVKTDVIYNGSSCPLSLNGGQAYRYFDDKFTVGSTYKYKVIAIYNDASQSAMGHEASITITN